MNQPTDWTQALIAAGIGLGIGIIATLRMRAEGRPKDEAMERRDEAAGWEALSEQLRSVHEAEENDPELAHHRYGLELRAAELLLAQGQRAELDGEAGEAAAAQTSASKPRAGWVPAVWGAVATAAILVPIMLVQSAATQRGEGGSITGNTGPAGGGAQATTQQQGQGRPIAAVPPELKPLMDQVTADPNNVELRLSLTRKLMGAGAMIPAYEQATAILKLDSKQAEAMAFLAIVRIEMGLHKQAASMLTEAIAIRPDLIEAWIYRGVANLRSGEPQAAIDDWQEVIKLRADAETVLKPMMERAQKMLSGEIPMPKPQAHPMGKPGAGHPGGAPGSGHPGKDPHAGHNHPPHQGHPVPGQQAGGGSIRVLVTAKPGVEIKPGSVMFVIGRAPGVKGGPPVAVKRVSVSMLPMQISLTGANTMMGGDLPKVLDISARIDADGDPMTKDDGPTGMVAGVKAGAPAPASLVIGAP